MIKCRLEAKKRLYEVQSVKSTVTDINAKTLAKILIQLGKDTEAPGRFRTAGPLLLNCKARESTAK